MSSFALGSKIKVSRIIDGEQFAFRCTHRQTQREQLIDSQLLLAQDAMPDEPSLIQLGQRVVVGSLSWCLVVTRKRCSQPYQRSRVRETTIDDWGSYISLRNGSKIKTEEDEIKMNVWLVKYRQRRVNLLIYKHSNALGNEAAHDAFLAACMEAPNVDRTGAPNEATHQLHVQKLHTQ